MQNRIFFPQSALDQWLVDGKVDLTATDLILLAAARRYKVVESVRVVAEVAGAKDAHALVGKVRPKADLERMGAEIVESSMLLGDNAYDVVPGWMGTPATPFEEYLLSPERKAARGGRTDVGAGPLDDEELLARFVGGAL